MLTDNQRRLSEKMAQVQRLLDDPQPGLELQIDECKETR